MTNISHNSKITIALLIILLGAAVSFGMLIQKVNNVEDRVVRIENKLDKALEYKSLTLKR